MLKDILSFSKGVLTDPETQFGKLSSGETGPAAPIAIYLIYVLAAALFRTVKPPDFPAEFAQLAIGEKSFGFYFFLEFFWGTALAAASSAFLLFFLGTFTSGKMFPKALFWTLVMLVCAGAASYARSVPFSLLLSAAGLLCMAAAIRRERTAYWRFFLASLSVCLINVVVLPLDLAAVYLRSENIFLTGELIAGLWMLALFAKIARIFKGASVPKAVVALAAGCAAAVLLLYLLRGAGVLSNERYELLLLS